MQFLSLGNLLELAALVIVAVLLFLILFEPAVAYRRRAPTRPSSSTT